MADVATGDRSAVLNGLRDVIERRVNLFGVAEPQVYVAQSGETSNLVVELAGIRDVTQAIDTIGATPLLDFREVQQNGSSTTFIPTQLTGRYITGAQVVFQQNTNRPEVALAFTDEGSKLFEQLTERNVGKPLAIFLDNNLISAPMVNEKIVGGNAVINGVELAEAKQLVERFNAGALPAPIKLVNQQTVNPSLGQDSLHKAMVAGLIGTIIVMLFMVLYYRLLGFFAALSLILYVVFSLALFKLIPITITLAGLAGFILTIGMAVDANILIFERVKEEMKRGVAKGVAIREGFRRAWPSIRDSNVATMITAIILYSLTSGFVRGFALTLLLGVIVSMFSAITTTRLFLLSFIRNARS